MKITKLQKENMEHALGLDYKKKPFRNYYCEYSPNKSWDELVDKGLATVRVIYDEHNYRHYYYYHVSEKGAKFLGVELPKD